MTDDKRWEAVQQALLPGEQVNWWDKPRPLWRRPRELAPFAVNLVLLVTGAVLLARLRRSAAGQIEDPSASQIIALITAIGLLVRGFWGAAPLPQRILESIRTIYAATDQRVLIIGHRYADSRWLEDVAVDVVIRRNDRGTISLDGETIEVTSGGVRRLRFTTFSFVDVADAASVAAALAERSARQVASVAVPQSPPAPDPQWHAWLSRVVQPDERLLWFGRPGRYPLVESLPPSKPLIAIGGIVLFMVPLLLPIALMLVVGFYVLNARVAAGYTPVYVLTDKRIVVWNSASPAQSEGRGLAGLVATLSLRADGSGTVYFDQARGVRPQYWKGHRVPPLAFVNIPDAWRVAQAMRWAKSLQPVAGAAPAPQARPSAMRDGTDAAAPSATPVAIQPTPWPSRGVTDADRWRALQLILSPGEAVHWWDRPRPLRIQLQAWFVYGACLVFALSSPFMLVAMLGDTTNGDEVRLALGLFGIPLVVGWLFGILGVVGLPLQARRGARTVYAITDSRAIVVAGTHVTVRPLAGASPDLTVERNGRGALVFEPASVRQRLGSTLQRRRAGFSFDDIADVERVAYLVRSLQPQRVLRA